MYKENMELQISWALDPFVPGSQTLTAMHGNDPGRTGGQAAQSHSSQPGASCILSNHGVSIQKSVSPKADPRSTSSSLVISSALLAERMASIIL